MDVYTHCMGMDGQESGPLCMYKYILYAFCCTWILIFLSVHFKHEKGLDKSYYSDVIWIIWRIHRPPMLVYWSTFPNHFGSLDVQNDDVITTYKLIKFKKA